MYRFLAKPRWIAFHLLVIALMVAMVNLAFWQLRRLDEKKALNRAVRDRGALVAAAVEQLLPVGVDASAVPAVQWRRVMATGTFDPAQLLIRSRSYNGRPGFHVVSTLVLTDGRRLLVNRGWIPITAQPGVSPTPPSPPAGVVTVEGRVRTSQHKGTFGAADPPTGTLTELNRLDVPRIAQQTSGAVLPAFIELDRPTSTSTPTATSDPALIPPPEPSEGPHLSYAVQWFIFTLCAAVGWVLVVRKSARSLAVAASPSTTVSASQ